MSHDEEVEMTKAPSHKIEEEIQSLREVGKMEWLFYERQKDTADDRVPEDTPLM